MSFKYITEENQQANEKRTYWWKEVNNEINDTLADLMGTVLFVHNSIESKDIMDFINKIRPGQFLDVLYISMMRSYQYLLSTLELVPLSEKKLFVMDCVTGYAFLPDDDIDNCFYHKPPSNLTEMKNIIELGIQKSNADIIIFDSLSHFINFSNPDSEELHQLGDFLNTIHENLLNINQSAFILLYDNKMSQLKNLPKAGFDTILRVEVEDQTSIKMI